MINFKANTLSMLVIICFIFSSAANARKAAPWTGETLTGISCSGKGQGYGPFDYTKRSGLISELRLVEGAHFQSGVEMLTEGTSGKSSMYSDLDYTLRAFPNHHRALNTLIRFTGKNIDYRRTGLSIPECYFLRALNFAPKDPMAHMLYGIFLYKLKKYELALQSYKIAEKYSPSNTQVQYNLGLLYIDLENYEEAKNYALKVYSKNFPLQGLKKKLEASGNW